MANYNKDRLRDNVPSLLGLTDSMLDDGVEVVEREVVVYQDNPNALTKLDDGSYVFKGFSLTSRGIVETGKVEQSDLMELGRVLFAFHDRMQIWIGDWLNKIDWEYAKSYKEFAFLTQRNPKTLRNWKSVMGKVDLSRRRDNLSYTHYERVASMPPEKQDYWLRIAAAEELNPTEMQERIRNRPQLIEASKPNIPEELIQAQKYTQLIVDHCADEFVSAEVQGAVEWLAEYWTNARNQLG